MSAERDIGVSLSGGGHRATVFGLGALLAISDADLRHRILSISSVSGGSIANGSVMVGPDFGTADTTEVDAHVAKVVRAIAERGILQGGAPATKWYLRSLIGSIVLAAVGFVVAVVAALATWPMVFGAAAASSVVLLLLTWRLLTRRSRAVERAIDIELLGDTRTTLAEQQARQLSIHHVICTTELQAGTTFFFSNRLVYGWDFGCTTDPTQIPLATPVQASACVPGAFRARSVRLAELNLPKAQATIVSPKGNKTVLIDRVVLEDGGVYDNMADEWEYGFTNRLHNRPVVGSAQPVAASQLVIVNASADWDELRPVTGNGLGFELAGLLRSKDVQYDVSTAHRRRALAQIFINSSTTGGPDGVFVQIDDNPYRLVKMFEPQPGTTPDEKGVWAAEARAFLDAYGVSEAEWDDIAAASAAVPTTLKPLGAATCAALLEHAYVLATANLHVILGYGDMTRSVDRARFASLAGSTPTPMSGAATP